MIPVLLQTAMPRRKVGHAEAMRRWQRKNRDHLRRYKRAWRAKQKRSA